MCHELWSTSVIFFFKVSIGCVLFCFFAEWVHSPPHSCSLWEYQCSHVAVKSGCCCGLHCKGKCGVSYALFASSPLGNTFGTEVWEAHPTLKGLDLAELLLLPSGVKGLSLGCWTQPELETSPLKTSVFIKRSCYFHGSSLAKGGLGSSDTNASTRGCNIWQEWCVPAEFSSPCSCFQWTSGVVGNKASVPSLHAREPGDS